MHIKEIDLFVDFYVVDPTSLSPCTYQKDSSVIYNPPNVTQVVWYTISIKEQSYKKFY